jgi:flagellar motor switch/type III secretory pathway protein FliN
VPVNTCPLTEKPSSAKVEPFAFAELATGKRILQIEVGTVSLRNSELDRLERGSVVVLENRVDDDVILRCGTNIVAKAAIAIVNGRIALQLK